MTEQFISKAFDSDFSVESRPIVIYALPFDEGSGGSLVLLELAHRLQLMGISVALWPFSRRAPYSARATQAKAILRSLLKPGFEQGPYNLPIARSRDLSEAIVVYPEIVDGNPLGGRRVVRWFLHRPGFHTGRVEYGNNEVYFFFQDAFNNPEINPDPTNRLQVTYVNSHYRQVNLGERQGTCYMVRKGAELAKGRIRSDELCLDDLSHQATAEAFNSSRFFRCFDPYTLYLVFAAVCGCIPVVEPVPEVAKEQWYPRDEDRYGIAYGWEDSEIAWAKETRPLLLERLRDAVHLENESIANFISVLRDRFP